MFLCVCISVRGFSLKKKKTTHHGWLNLLAVDEISVFGHVTRWVHQILHVSEETLIFSR